MDFFSSFTALLLDIYSIVGGVQNKTALANDLIGTSVDQAFLDLAAALPKESFLELKETIAQQNTFGDIFGVLARKFGEDEVKKVLIQKLHGNLLTYIDSVSSLTTEEQKGTIEKLLDESNLFDLTNISELVFSWML